MAHARITIHDVNSIKVEARRYDTMPGGYLEIRFFGAPGEEDTLLVAHVFNEEAFERLRQGAPREAPAPQGAQGEREQGERDAPIQGGLPF